MSNNRNEHANKNQGRHEGNSSRSDSTRESSQQTSMNDKNRMPKPLETANAGKESQTANAPEAKHASEQTGEKEGRNPSNKDSDHGGPKALHKQERALAPERAQSGHVDREHDGPSHGDEPSQTNKTAEKPSQLTKESKPAKPPKAKNHDSFYLGLASAVLVAALGLSLSTMPIFFSLPLAAVLFGIGIWLLSYASFKSPGKPEEEGTEADKHTRTVVVATVLLVLQTFIMDVFIFTRMGTINKHQNAIVIAWIIASMIETLAAFALIYHHDPLHSKSKEPIADGNHDKGA